jgi:hypothetical protein
MPLQNSYLKTARPVEPGEKGASALGDRCSWYLIHFSIIKGGPFKYWKDIERLEVVGESKLEAVMAVFCEPFMAARIPDFEHAKLDQAESGIESE